jgi:hypothetical protein
MRGSYLFEQREHSAKPKRLGSTYISLFEIGKCPKIGHTGGFNHITLLAG